MTMHLIAETPSPAYSHAFGGTLSLEDLRHRTPAVFADSASERTRPTYRFINTHAVLQALFDAGFQVANARQTRTRHGTDPIHARHMIRLRPMREILTLDSCIPEVCLINAHDGTSAYQLLAGLYRPLCRNGLICRMGDFAMIRIPHRANVLADVVAGARELTLQFDRIGALVHAMAARMLSEAEQMAFATRALEIRWADPTTRPRLLPARLLEARQTADATPSLWHTFNTVQQATLAGGVVYQSAKARLVRTRRIVSIREDVRVNCALWQAAVQVLES
jgi:hypothetical protein